MQNIKLKVKAPFWFLVAGILLLLWNLMGVMNYFQHMTLTPEAIEAMPENQRQIFSHFPFWLKIVFGLAVFCGTLGSIALLMKKRIAKQLFVVSFISSFVQMLHSVYITWGMGPDATWVYIITTLIILIGIYAIWLSDDAIKKNWLV